jgi:EAL domain-containing protein (putative c-di-GMP-specific phosphodiesterase class I)/GGDEF domain-containing protein
MPNHAAQLEAAQAERNRFIAFAFAVAEVVLEVDRAGAIRFSAGAAENLFGKPNEAMLGDNLFELLAPKDRAPLKKSLDGFPLGKRMKSLVVSALQKSGPPKELRVSAYRLPTDDTIAYVSVSLYRPGPAATGSATPKAIPPGARDAITGLATKEAFADAVRERVKHLQESGESGSLTMVDMDGLADVRPHLEQGVEEEILAKVGALLTSNSLGEGLGGRLDRDKFSFLHAPSLDVDAIAGEVEKLVQSASPWAADFKTGVSTVEIGAEGLTEEDMSQALMYTLNNFVESSGSAIAFGSLTEGCKGMLAETVNWQQRIKKTIADDGFFLAYQPIVELESGFAHHFEALTRLKDDPQGSPFKFITMAEQLGLVADYDWAVMQRVFKVLRQADVKDPVPIAVNISGRSLATPKFVEDVIALIKRNPDLKDYVLFEVTESSKIPDLQAANRSLRRFRELGIPVCLDDFGVGAAAFEYLRCLQVDYVKIDGSFVRDAAHSKFSGGFVKSIAALCKDLGIQTIAEMVEDNAAVRLMRASGVDHGQGWHFGKPGAELPWRTSIARSASTPVDEKNWDPTLGRRVSAR